MATKIEYQAAPAVEAVAARLIGAHHPHLAEVGILYLFTNQDRKEDRKVVAATIQKLTPMQRFLLSGSTVEGDEYVVLVNLSLWRELEPNQQRALIDHELLHLREVEDEDADGNATTRIGWSDGHDVMLFQEEIERHGAWNRDIQVIAKQLRLWEDAATKAGGEPVFSREQLTGVH